MKLCYCLIILAVLVGCTVIPKVPRPTTPSFDGNDLNSGIVGTNGLFYILSDGGRERYNNNIVTYGNSFSPPIVPNFGITAPYTNGTWLMTRDGMVKFIKMARLRRAPK